DPYRCDQRQGQYLRDRRAMAAVRQFECTAHHRQRPARPMVERLSALPRRARRNSAAKLICKASSAQNSILARGAICFTRALPADLLTRFLKLGRCTCWIEDGFWQVSARALSRPV